MYFKIYVNGKEVIINMDTENASYNEYEIKLDIPIKLNVNDTINLEAISRYEISEDSEIKFIAKDFTNVDKKQ